VKLGRIGLLFLLVLGLGAYLYWVEVPKARQEATKGKLVTAAADDVTAIGLVFPTARSRSARRMAPGG